MTKHYNKKELQYNRKHLRNNATEAEKLLWKFIRKKQLGYRFLRQYSVDNYILDFYCSKVHLALEVDGSHHAEANIVEYDKVRTIHLEHYNIKVIRFWNSEITNDLDRVLKTIAIELNCSQSNL